MEYKDFVYKEDSYTAFVQMRKTLNEIIANPEDYNKSFDDVFAEIGALAMDGNAIAQDLMSYYYKNGVEGHIPENYDQYMKWAILAGANGNEFALEKLQFFLNYGLTELVSDESKIQRILNRNGITEENYIYILGNLLCEGLVDSLHITAKDLVEEKPKVVHYTPEKLRGYKREIDKVIPKVMEYLLV